VMTATVITGLFQSPQAEKAQYCDNDDDETDDINDIVHAEPSL
jgi:hypothetical protein